ncbi:hypothetical protein QEH56_02800 [Pelagicoccus enzymogenes]|uniref:hypothetical protein n=1 Tax=Pelagicoccus enzymogenes TaxID=2773457 RepID=UPI00280DA424|nr:hypothetical protein [Pelagicoccus enzymogenes]MDQ8197057.1 hypothetical protein [Pelagicoccus enzymogenes]
MKKILASSLAVAAFAFGGAVVHGHPDHHVAPGKDLEGEAITGNGIHTYVTVPGWGAFDDGNALGPTHGGIAVSKNGNVYVSTDGDRSICVFDSEGNFLQSIAPDCVGTHALFMSEENGEEFLYGAHLKGQRIVKMTLDGEVLLSIEDGAENPIPEGLNGVTAISVGDDGRIYAGIGYGSNFVHVFSPEGKLLKSFGSKGEGIDQFRACHGMSIDMRFGEPRLLIADRENRRLKHYDLEGNLIGVFAENLRRPCAISFFGDYCAIAELEGRVTILDKEGVVVAFLGDNPVKEQWAKYKTPLDAIPAGLFTAPHGLSYDSEGNIFVQDWNETGRLTRLNRLYSE